MSQAESDTISRDSATSKRSGLPWYVWVCVALPFVYVLSFGPFLKLYDLGYIRPHGALDAVAGKVYAPLGWAAANCAALDNFLVWYFHVWGVSGG
jgi:hypothetical protein